MIGAKVSRRAFLLVLGGVTGLAGLLFSRIGRSNASRATGGGRPASAEGRGSEPRSTDGDLDTLVALGFVLVPSSFAEPGGAGVGSGLVGVVESLLRKRLNNLKTSRPAAQEEFRSAAALLDRESSLAHASRFAELDLHARCRLVAGILQPFANRTALTAPYYYLTPRGGRVRRLWDSVASPLLMAFHGSELGWRVVGYPGEPGNCSDLVSYQSPPT